MVANDAKSALRERMRRIRADIPEEERERLGGRVAANVLELDALREAACVFVFDAFGTEVPTRDLVRALLERGVRVLMPYVDGERMEAAELRSAEELEPTSYGPREPRGRDAVDPSAIDVVVAPGLAFDREGRRLGYGGGHYDRYLKRVPERATRVGIAFAAQVVDAVPTDEADERVDVIVTEDGVIEARRDAGGAEDPSV